MSCPNNAAAVGGICPGPASTDTALSFTLTLNVPQSVLQGWSASYLTSTVEPELAADIAAAIGWPANLIIVVITGDPTATVVVLPEPSGSSAGAPSTVQQLLSSSPALANGPIGRYVDTTTITVTNSMAVYCGSNGYASGSSCPGSSSSSSFAGWKIAVIVIAGVIFIGIIYATYYFCIAGARKNPGVVLEPYEDTSLHPVDGPAPVSYSSGETTGPTGQPQQTIAAQIQANGQPQPQPQAIQMSSVAVATATPAGVSTAQVGVTVV